MSAPYLGRFAPSPTGPLHFGSLIAALASYLDARAHNGHWLIRLEDVDSSRCHPEYAQSILDCLHSYHLISDGPILYQTQRTERYQQQLDYLNQHHHIFACNCTRQHLQRTEMLHNGLCNGTTLIPHSWRLCPPNGEIIFQDRLQGNLHYRLSSTDNAPVLKRKDGLFSYQLAVVVDDHDQNISHVVRGADLLENTPIQLYLYQLFNWQPPSFLHIPLLTDTAGQKISKQNHAIAIPHADTIILQRALTYLGIELNHSTDIASMLTEATALWQPQRVSAQIQQTVDKEDIALATQGKPLFP